MLVAVMAANADNIVGFRLSRENGLPNNQIRILMQQPNGEMFMSSNYDAFAYDGYSFRALPDSIYRRLKKLAKKTPPITGIPSDDNLGNKVWIEHNDLVYKDVGTGRVTRIDVGIERLQKTNPNLKCRVLTDHSGHIWISLNGGGIYVHDKKSRTTQHLTKDSPDHLLLTDMVVYMTIDSKDNVWVAEDHYGLLCLRAVSDNYRHLSPMAVDGDEHSMEMRMLTNLSDGRIVMANTANQWLVADSMLGNAVITSMGDENILSAEQDRQGRIWLGGKMKGVFVDGQQVAEGRTDAIVCDRKGRMWTGGLNRGLAVFDTNEHGMGKERRMHTNLEIHHVLCDHRGDIWVAATQGLFVFSPDSLLADTATLRRVIETPMRTLYEDSSNRLWAGSVSKGLYCLENARQRATRYTVIDMTGGLISNYVQSIIENGDRHICIGTMDGCSLYDPKTKKIAGFYIKNHWVRNFYSESCAARMADGRIVLGTTDGLIILPFMNELLTPQKQLPEAVITNMFINGVSVYEHPELLQDKTAVSDLKQLEVDYTHNSLTFHFSSFIFERYPQTLFSYRLEGHDNNWSEASRQNSVSYKNLPPGKYTLKIRSREINGEWGKPATMDIMITPPMWATWWAYIIYVVAVVVIGILIYRQILHVSRLRMAVAVEKQLTEYKLKFFANITHEFRTPLTLIKGSMDRMSETDDVPATLRPPLNSMQRNVDRLMRLVNQLLEFRRMQNNQLQLSLEETDVVSFVYNICQGFRETAEHKNITMNFLPAMKSYTAFIDRGFIDKAVYNLLSNAFKYTPAKGSVTVRVRTLDNATFCIMVEDTGIGVPEDMREKIFVRFQRGLIGRDSLGIGLDFTAELIRTHHGSIRCEANPAGEGSVFTITLPADKTVYKNTDFVSAVTDAGEGHLEQKRGFSEQVRETMIEPMNNHRILIVEDDADISEYLQKELGRFFVVTTAANGEEALEILADREFDLIITDVMMPRMNGYDLLVRLRQNERTRSLPVIMLTALGDPDQQLKGMEVGADAYITKPFSLALIILQCRNLLQRGDCMRDVVGNSAAAEEGAAGVEQPSRRVTPDIITDERDRKLLSQLEQCVLAHLSDPTLSVDKFAEEMGYSRSKFYVKLKSLTGQTPNDYIKELRLQRAYQLLQDRHVNVSEVSYQVGLGTPQYFSTVFKKRFGVTPKKFQMNN